MLDNNIFLNARKGYLVSQKKSSATKEAKATEILLDKEILSAEQLYNIQKFMSQTFGNI